MMHVEQLFYSVGGADSFFPLKAGDIVAVIFSRPAHPFAPEQVGLIVSARPMIENGIAKMIYSVFFPTSRAQQDVPKRSIFGAWRLIDEQEPATSGPALEAAG